MEDITNAIKIIKPFQNPKPIWNTNNIKQPKTSQAGSKNLRLIIFENKYKCSFFSGDYVSAPINE